MEPNPETEGDEYAKEKTEVPNPEPDVDKFAEEKSEEPNPESEGDKFAEDKTEVPNPEPERENFAEEKSEEPNPEPGETIAEEKSEEANPEPEGETIAEEKSEETNPEPEGEKIADEKSDEPNTEPEGDKCAEEKIDEPNPEPGDKCAEEKSDEPNPELEGDKCAEEKSEEPNPEPEGDKYAKAKIEEPNLRLPKALLKPDGDPNDDLCYMRIFEEDGRRSKHLAEAVAAGAQATRKVYRIRNKELIKVLGPDDEIMKLIHRVSKATIGILADAESNEHRQSYMDLVGTVEEVRTAEELILDEVLKTYDDMIFPVILMPPTVHHHQMSVPFFKLLPLIGVRRRNILRMEMVSGAWIKIDVSRSPPGGSELDRVVDIYGPRTNVIRAILNVQSVICEPWESAEVEKKLREQFDEPEIIDGQFRTSDGRHAQQSAAVATSSSVEIKDSEKQVEEAEGGCSTGTQKEKQQDVDETGKGKAAAED